MHLLIIGATGGTGRALVEQASGRGHRVTAFARSPEKLGSPPSRVTVVQGDPRNAAELQAAMLDCDAVISALGPPLPPASWPRHTSILGEGARATVEAMIGAGVRRLLILSGDVQFPDGGPLMALLRATLLRHLARDQGEMERVTRSSGLEWTIVRPTRLTNGALTGAPRAEVGHLPRGAQGISRADVAHFLLGAAERGEHVREVVGLSR